ncbi:TIGR01548 family HAD-type hydrolase [Merismopedia glauca CCAP 1448/3]|uniref:TIGR01548 family HAD-type hydrolase n=1 Tax=Merismopedia glauca CCAP 1448/3 TaxID=1296344 RepID=A0A2T1BXH2_9CYAN|nr:TIGR01548 family HAD-type hydrolase [Merismopedia glauca CCAP 1448/3]
MTLARAIAIFDIDGVIRDVSGSYRRAIADTVAYFTQGKHRPSPADIDNLKSEGIWNNDWEATQELTYRYFETQGVSRDNLKLDYQALVDFFQSRYRGSNLDDWNGYICQEKLLISAEYLDSLTQNGIAWGFFSGAPRDEANYVLKKRLGLENPMLIAMEDAPGKPDPTGLFMTVENIENKHNLPQDLPVIYAGDTVADIYTVGKAKSLFPQRIWLSIGILPPHILAESETQVVYTEKLTEAGADLILRNLETLTPWQIQRLL